MHPKDAEGIANSVDPDQTASLGAVWSGFALFAQTWLSENLGTLRYIEIFKEILNLPSANYQCWINYKWKMTDGFKYFLTLDCPVQNWDKAISCSFKLW